MAQNLLERGLCKVSSLTKYGIFVMIDKIVERLDDLVDHAEW